MVILIGLILVAIVVGGIISMFNTNRGITTQMMARGFFLGLTCGAFAGAAIACIDSRLNTGMALIAVTQLETVIFWLIAVSLPGVLLGGVSGAVVGVLSGLVLGIVTSRFFAPLQNTTRYQLTMTIIGIITTVCLVIIAGRILGTNSFQYSADGYHAEAFTRDITLFIVLPAMFGAILAVPSSLCVARRYIAKSLRGYTPTSY